MPSCALCLKQTPRHYRNNRFEGGIQEIERMLGEIEIDDLIDSDFGKHDYDWLLAPPETPRRAPSSLPSETQTSSTSVTRQSNLGSVSTATASKASTPQLQNAHSPKPAAKTSSLNRPSTSNLRSPSSNNNNTSRASTRNTNATTVSSKSLNPRNPSATTRPSRPTPTPSRPQTPATRSVPISSGPKTARPQISRPSTSQCRRQAPTFSSPTVTSRRPSVPVTIPTSYRAALVVQERNSPLSSPKPPASMSPCARAPVQPNDIRSNLRAGAPNSPNPRTRTPIQPNDTPSNLRTGLLSSLSPRARAPVQPSNASLPHRKSLPGNVAGSSTRPNTPGTRARVSVQQIVIPAFSSDVQPNLRTTPRNSPTSAGKVRAGAGTASTQNATSPSSLCRHSLPIQSHSRVPANSSPRSPLRNKGNVGALAEIQKNGISGVRKTNKVNSVMTESTELGRSKVENWLENDIKESHAVKQNADEGSYDIYESSQYDRMLMKGTSHDHNWLRTVEGKLCESCEIQRFESLPNPFGHQ